MSPSEDAAGQVHQHENTSSKLLVVLRGSVNGLCNMLVNGPAECIATEAVSISRHLHWEAITFSLTVPRSV